MKLDCSCQCGKVRFSVESRTPYPYQRCYCSICRKSGGGGGFAINLSGDAETLSMTGAEHKSFYHARMHDGESEAERHFCKECGSALYLYDARWPELIHPIAAVVDTPLPRPPEIVHIMLGSKAGWVDVPEGEGHVHFDGYPELSIDDWHRKHGLLQD